MAKPIFLSTAQAYALANTLSGATLYAYLGGTTTATPFYSDKALTTSLGVTLTSDSAGRFTSAFLPSDLDIKLRLVHASTSTDITFDYASITDGGTSTSNDTIDKNRIINGDMAIDQENEGAAVTVNSAARTYSVDQWFGFGQGADGVFTLQRVDNSAGIGNIGGGSKYGLKWSVTTADASVGAAQTYHIGQCLEGYRIVDLLWGTSNARPIVLSFVAYVPTAGTYSGAIRSASGGRSYPFTFSVGSANAHTAITVNIPGDTSGTWAVDNTEGMTVVFDLGSGANGRGTAGAWSSNSYFGATGALSPIGTVSNIGYFTSVQIEAAASTTDSATGFEFRPEPEEMRRCQRYFRKSFSPGTVPAQNAGSNIGDLQWPAMIAGANSERRTEYRFPVVMRASPTITTYSPSAATAEAYDATAAAACTGTTIFNTTARGFSVLATGAAGTAVGNSIRLHYKAVSRM